MPRLDAGQVALFAHTRQGRWKNAHLVLIRINELLNADGSLDVSSSYLKTDSTGLKRISSVSTADARGDKVHVLFEARANEQINLMYTVVDFISGLSWMLKNPDGYTYPARRIATTCASAFGGHPFACHFGNDYGNLSLSISSGAVATDADDDYINFVFYRRNYLKQGSQACLLNEVVRQKRHRNALAKTVISTETIMSSANNLDCVDASKKQAIDLEHISGMTLHGNRHGEMPLAVSYQYDNKAFSTGIGQTYTMHRDSAALFIER